MPERTERVIRNRNFRHPVTVISERPDLSELGDAGARLSVELMLSAPEGVPSRKLERLETPQREALRRIASEEDPARGILLQKAALGALGQLRDQGASLLMARLAERPDVDARVRLEAIASLGTVGAEGTRDVLLNLIDSAEPEARAQAAKALEKLGKLPDVGLLEAVAEEDDSYVGTIAGAAAAALRDRLLMEER